MTQMLQGVHLQQTAALWDMEICKITVFCKQSILALESSWLSLFTSSFMTYSSICQPFAGGILQVGSYRELKNAQNKIVALQKELTTLHQVFLFLHSHQSGNLLLKMCIRRWGLCIDNRLHVQLQKVEGWRILLACATCLNFKHICLCVENLCHKFQSINFCADFGDLDIGIAEGEREWRSKSPGQQVIKKAVGKVVFLSILPV